MLININIHGFMNESNQLHMLYITTNKYRILCKNRCKHNNLRVMFTEWVTLSLIDSIFRQDWCTQSLDIFSCQFIFILRNVLMIKSKSNLHVPTGTCQGLASQGTHSRDRCSCFRRTNSHIPLG